jgi:NAD(P)-dependent dehydrogenase (short-subunit alcohol dehydrogenase family)
METPEGHTGIRPHGRAVTRGNGGIGLGIAQALAAAGCNVSIWGRNADKNKAAAATMAGAKGKTDTRVCDVSDPASVKAAMAATLEAFGRVDGCFANAGIGGGGRRAFIERTEEEWRTMFATNLDGVFHVFQAAARHMTERATAGDPFGRLVATSSMASFSAPRATSITPPPRPPSTRCAARSRSNWRARASPPTPSCPAGSRAT